MSDGRKESGNHGVYDGTEEKKRAPGRVGLWVNKECRLYDLVRHLTVVDPPLGMCLLFLCID